VWGDGSAVRSYTYVSDMVDGIYALTHSELHGAVNIGCPQYVTVDELALAAAKAAGKRITIRHVDGPVGVHSRNFSNARIYALGWTAKVDLEAGLALTYPWIDAQAKAARAASR
jgi:nucleoside-diphosphate-sugar epimerase